MFFDDFIAQQTLKTIDSSYPHRGGVPRPRRGLLSTLWSGLRQIAWGIDAMSSIRHGVEVPPDHGARRQRRRPDRHPHL
jgi:hypothetical protein